jgi:hypothetical protein
MATCEDSGASKAASGSRSMLTHLASTCVHDLFPDQEGVPNALTSDFSDAVVCSVYTVISAALAVQTFYEGPY